MALRSVFHWPAKRASSPCEACCILNHPANLHLPHCGSRIPHHLFSPPSFISSFFHFFILPPPSSRSFWSFGHLSKSKTDCVKTATINIDISIFIVSNDRVPEIDFDHFDLDHLDHQRQTRAPSQFGRLPINPCNTNQRIGTVEPAIDESSRIEFSIGLLRGCISGLNTFNEPMFHEYCPCRCRGQLPSRFATLVSTTNF